MELNMEVDRKVKRIAPLEQLAPELLAAIANELEDKDVSNVIMASTLLCSKLDRFLYARDAVRPAPKSLKHAIFCGNDELGVTILQKYPKSFVEKCVNTIFKDDNGSIYTALHITAGLGYHNMIKELHKLGAKSTHFGVKLRKVLGAWFNGQLQQHEYLRPYISQTMWMPNFAPLVKRDFKTFAILEKLYPGPCVAVAAKRNLPVDLESDHEAPDWVLNLHHLAPLINSYKLLEFALKKYQAYDEAPGGVNRQSVLHFAVKARCLDVIDQLVQVEVGFGDHFVDRDGCNPLHHAVYDAIQDDLEKRAECRSLIKRLLDVSLNPTTQQIGGKWQTPLLIVADFIPLDWSSKFVAIKFVLRALLDRERSIRGCYGLHHHSAMINFPDSHGNTLLSTITKEIIARKGNESLENLFKDMIGYGADVNLDVNTIVNPGRYIHSIRHRVANANKKGLKRFIKLLDDRGATLHAAEQSGNLTAHGASGQQPYVQTAPFDQPTIEGLPTSDEIDEGENHRIVQCLSAAFKAIVAANPAQYIADCIANGQTVEPFALAQLAAQGHPAAVMAQLLPQGDTDADAQLAAERQAAVAHQLTILGRAGLLQTTSTQSVNSQAGSSSSAAAGTATAGTTTATATATAGTATAGTATAGTATAGTATAGTATAGTATATAGTATAGTATAEAAPVAQPNQPQN